MALSLNNKSCNRSPKMGILYFVLFCLLLSSCNTQPKKEFSTNSCINSFDSFAYKSPKEKITNQERFLPQQPWEKVSAIPKGITDEGLSYFLETTRLFEDHIEVWLINRSRNFYDYERNPSSVYYLAYRTDLQTWQKIPAQIDDTNIFVGKLFVTDDGSIWGQNYWGIKTKEIETYPLSKYNEDTGKFELFTKTPKLPLFNNDDWAIISLEKKESFWIFINGDAVYYYSILNNKFEEMGELPNIIVSDVAFDSSGNIYIKNKLAAMNLSITKDELSIFKPSTNELIKLSPPTQYWPNFWGLLIDHNDRLWLGSVGWREINGQWNRLVPNIGLYWWKVYIEADYRWIPPQIIMESSNGNLWFGGENDRGVAWMNLETGESCWFTTINTNVVEDVQNTIWINSDTDLYKYSQ